jgi:polyisoprenoid-binding protein YceI
MKTKNVLLILLAAMLLQFQLASAQSSKLKGFKMTVKGTSTMHDWESTVEKLECKSTFKTENNSLTEIKEAVVKIPVQSIKSPKGKMMDNKTYEAFDYEKNPAIVFSLTTIQINALKLTADARGTLSMAGTTKSIDLPVTYKLLTNGDLLIIGSKKIKMTDYKMEPPTAMMGAVKVGDEVTISFELTLTNSNTIL